MPDGGVDLGLGEQGLVGGANAAHGRCCLDQPLIERDHRPQALEQRDHLRLQLRLDRRRPCITGDTPTDLDGRVGHHPHDGSVGVGPLQILG